MCKGTCSACSTGSYVELAARLDKMDAHLKQVVQDTSRILTNHKNNIEEVAKQINNLTLASNTNVDSIMSVCEGLRGDVDYLHQKIVDPFGGVSLDNKGRLLH